MAITRLWWFTLQPAVSPTDPAFTSLWTDVLELCATYTPSPGPSSSHGHVATLSQPCPRRPHHFLFQAVSSHSPGGGGQQDEAGEPVFVLISSYPSLALCAQADAAYRRTLRPRVLESVRHRVLRQVDMEDPEVVPALLSHRHHHLRKRRLSSSSGEGGRGRERESGGGGTGGDGSSAAAADAEENEDDDDRQPDVSVIISSRDPLRSEVAESLSSRPDGKRLTVPPPDEEISGADVYVPPPVGGEVDLLGPQRGEGKKWVRISRRPGAGGGDGDVEVFRLKELLSR